LYTFCVRGLCPFLSINLLIIKKLKKIPREDMKEMKLVKRFKQGPISTL